MGKTVTKAPKKPQKASKPLKAAAPPNADLLIRVQKYLAQAGNSGGLMMDEITKHFSDTPTLDVRFAVVRLIDRGFATIVVPGRKIQIRGKTK